MTRAYSRDHCQWWSAEPSSLTHRWFKTFKVSISVTQYNIRNALFCHFPKWRHAREKNIQYHTDTPYQYLEALTQLATFWLLRQEPWPSATSLGFSGVHRHYGMFWRGSLSPSLRSDLLTIEWLPCAVDDWTLQLLEVYFYSWAMIWHLNVRALCEHPPDSHT